MSFRRTRRRAGYAVCQYNIQTWDWSVLNRKVRADFIWQQGNRADVSLFYIFTKQQAWPWWPGTQERGACASQLAEHKERSAYHVNVQSDGEVSVSPVRQIPAVPFYLAEGCGIPAPGSRAPGRGAWWISHGAGRLCLAAGLSEWRWAQEGASLCNVPPLPAEIRPGQSNEHTLNREDSSTPLGERGKNGQGRRHLLKEHDLILHWGPAALPRGKPRNRKTAVISLCQDKLGYCHRSCRGGEQRTSGRNTNIMQTRAALHQKLSLSFSGHTLQLELVLTATATPSSFSSVLKGKWGLRL